MCVFMSDACLNCVYVGLRSHMHALSSFVYKVVHVHTLFVLDGTLYNYVTDDRPHCVHKHDLRQQCPSTVHK